MSRVPGLVVLLIASIGCVQSDARNIVASASIGGSFPAGPDEFESQLQFDDPARHRYWVEVTIPSGTIVELDLIDPDGQVAVAFDNASFDCRESGGDLVCAVDPFFVRGHPPGLWTIVVRKLSEEPAMVDVNLAIELPGR